MLDGGSIPPCSTKDTFVNMMLSRHEGSAVNKCLVSVSLMGQYWFRQRMNSTLPRIIKH